MFDFKDAFPHFFRSSYIHVMQKLEEIDPSGNLYFLTFKVKGIF